MSGFENEAWLATVEALRKDPDIVRNRFLFALVLGLIGALFSPLGAAEKDPFAEKFGGPYKDGVSAGFRKNLVEYGGGLKGAFGSLGVEGFKDRKGFEEFCKDFIDPALAKLVPKTDKEEKLKEAAVWVRTAFVFAADPDSLPEGERKAMKEFLHASTLPGEEAGEINQFGGLLLRFSAYALGMGFSEYHELLKKGKERE